MTDARESLTCGDVLRVLPQKLGNYVVVVHSPKMGRPTGDCLWRVLHNTAKLEADLVGALAPFGTFGTFGK